MSPTRTRVKGLRRACASFLGWVVMGGVVTFAFLAFWPLETHSPNGLSLRTSGRRVRIHADTTPVEATKKVVKAHDVHLDHHHDHSHVLPPSTTDGPCGWVPLGRSEWPTVRGLRQPLRGPEA